MKKLLQLNMILVLLLVTFISGCGGGGRSSSTPSGGDNGSSTPPVNGGPVPVIISGNKMSAGFGYHNLVIRNGSIWVWGRNHSGQLGVGNTSEHLNTPTEIRTLTGVKAVASGINRSLAVTTDGAVYGWGFNGGGYIGEGGTSPKIIYPAILTNIAAVEMGSGDLFLALSADGKVYVWGINWGGDREKSYTPLQISQSSFNNKRVVAISAGYTHSLALTEDGQVWAWGEYSFGDAEDRTIVKNEAPTLAEGLEKDVTAISGGDNFSVALKTDGTVWAWGEINNSATPVPVSGLSGITAIAVGGQYCMALGSDGKVRVWGSFSSETYDVPKVVALSKVTAIAAGTGRCLAKTSDGKLWAWGDNTYGALGDGTTTSREDPVEVKFE